jgi:hypothetical protein
MDAATRGGLMHRRASRWFLGVSAVVWTPYGLYCMWRPESLRAAAGIAVESATGATELRAMYGGLQIAIGALALLGFARPASARGTIVALAFLCTGLGSARLLGVAVDGGVTAYTTVALIFEWGSALVAWTALGSEPSS